MRAIVVGAGPGGATAALELARAGADVSLAEKSEWPRDKTCGDGVSPLGIREGRELGLTFEGGARLRTALVSTPGDLAFRGGWPPETPWGTTIERRVFDAQIVAAAVGAGSRFMPATAVKALESRPDGIVATFESGGKEWTQSADVAVIAEGATGTLAARLGFPRYRSRLVALRGYVDSARTLEPEYGLFYERALSPGYGWIFPMDERRANVGILVDERTLRYKGGNLRALLAEWLGHSRFVRDILGACAAPTGVRGGVIPTGRRTRTGPRIFLIGDAAGVADPFTAEGIFQALQSGRLAARALTSSLDLRAARKRYEHELRAFDRNERAARALRATFAVAIEPYARRAASRPVFADHLNTDVFFPKKSFRDFVWRSLRAW